MKVLSLILVFECVSVVADAAVDCPVTLFDESHVDVPGFEYQGRDLAWYGTSELAVLIRKDGDYPTRVKSLTLWREGEWDLDRVDVVARSMDDVDEVATSWWTTSAHFPDGSSVMHNPISFPSAGCWEVTAAYHHDAALNFVTMVTKTSDFHYGSTTAWVADAANAKQLIDKLVSGLRMRDYFGFTWQPPNDWASFETALREMPLPQTVFIKGFARLEERLPEIAWKMRATLDYAASFPGHSSISYQED